jgi:hypothetical protein
MKRFSLLAFTLLTFNCFGLCTIHAHFYRLSWRYVSNVDAIPHGFLAQPSNKAKPQ